MNGSEIDRDVEQKRLRRFREAIAREQLNDLLHRQPRDSRERKLHLIRLAAPIAAVALDARLSGNRAMHADERWLMQLAVVAWQTTFADKTKRRTVWKVVRAANGQRGDLFCLFCGDFMHAVTRRKRDWHGADFSTLVESHTTICGLTWLAGMSDAVARDLVRLPSEFRATSDAAATVEAG